jgi:hypothetical protein
MAYDLNRCPQNEDEARDYIFTIYQRSIGQPANDWAAVQQNSNLPRNIYTPGLQATDKWPFFGITQMWGAGGPRGRIFLPADSPDDNNWWTVQIQVIADGPSGGLVWAWNKISGNAYKPVTSAAVQPPGGGVPPVIIAPGGGLSKEEVQAMIDASIAAALASGSVGVKIGDKIALRTNSGMIAGIEGGGPTTIDAPIKLIGKQDIHAWESFTLEQGE